MGFDSSHTNFYSVKKVVSACLRQHRHGHARGAHEGEIAEPLNVFPRGFSAFLNRREELIHGHLGVILVKSRKESGFQINLRIDGALGKAPELIKGYSLRVPMNSLAMTALLYIMLSVFDRK